MKIEKGITLEQFVDWAGSNKDDEWTCEELIKEAEECGCTCGGIIASAMVNYNNRLKEPLTKDMFCNPYEEPTKETYFVDGELKEKYYLEDLETWQEAENRVIFKDVRIEKIKSLGLRKIFAGNYKVAHDWGSEIIFLDKTLSDLFRATNGELELKNFEV